MISSRLLPDFPSPIERDRWKNLILMRIALIIQYSNEVYEYRLVKIEVFTGKEI